jgi:hypothetical protein
LFETFRVKLMAARQHDVQGFFESHVLVANGARVGGKAGDFALLERSILGLDAVWLVANPVLPLTFLAAVFYKLTTSTRRKDTIDPAIRTALTVGDFLLHGLGFVTMVAR